MRRDKQIRLMTVLIAVSTFLPLKNNYSQSYSIDRSVIAAGGSNTISERFGISSTTGQTIGGIISGNNNQMYIGFWAIQSLSPYGVIVTPRKFTLSQNYPNPFNSSTLFLLDLPMTSDVNFTLFDILGHSVKRLHSGELRAGSHTFSWDGKNVSGNFVSSGIYYATITTPNFRKTIKLILLK